MRTRKNTWVDTGSRRQEFAYQTGDLIEFISLQWEGYTVTGNYHSATWDVVRWPGAEVIARYLTLEEARRAAMTHFMETDPLGALSLVREQGK